MFNWLFIGLGIIMKNNFKIYWDFLRNLWVDLCIKDVCMFCCCYVVVEEWLI